MGEPIIQRTGRSGFGLRNIPGYRAGFVVQPHLTINTSVIIKTGAYEVSGQIFTLATNATHPLTSLAAGFDHHYVYLDKSASTTAIPAFYDETTEPVKNIVKNGWYHPTNTEDRVVGNIISEADFTTVSFFGAIQNGNTIRNQGYSDKVVMAVGMNPTSAWVSPNTMDGDVATPVNAVAIQVELLIRDTNAKCAAFATTAEGSVIDTDYFQGFAAISGYNSVEMLQPFFPLGASRNIKISGDDDDENGTLGCRMYGHEYET